MSATVPLEQVMAQAREIKALTAEVKRLRAREALKRVGKTEWAIYKEDIAKIKTAHWLQVQALQARLARLEEALTTYGNHLLTCAKWEDTTDFTSEPCTCGRDAALERR